MGQLSDRDLGSSSIEGEATPSATQFRRGISRRILLSIMGAGFAIPAAFGLSYYVDIMPAKQLRWVVFYGQTTDEAVLATYDIVILDPGFLGSIKAVAASGAQVFGYLSLGEIRVASSFFDRVDPEAVLGASLSSEGARKLDIRHPSWQSLVLDQLVPAMLAQGFNGLMLDTLDTPAYLELIDAKHNAGMRQAAIDLVHAIRKRHPKLKLIANRGYALLPNLVDILDALIAESLLTRPNASGGGSGWTEASEVSQQLKLLAPATRRAKPLPILSLDYWPPEDTATIQLIYRRERKLGHHPYVTTPLMDQIIPEPQTA